MYNIIARTEVITCLWPCVGDSRTTSSRQEPTLSTFSGAWSREGLSILAEEGGHAWCAEEGWTFVTCLINFSAV